MMEGDGRIKLPDPGTLRQERNKEGLILVSLRSCYMKLKKKNVGSPLPDSEEIIKKKDDGYETKGKIERKRWHIISTIEIG